MAVEPSKDLVPINGDSLPDRQGVERQLAQLGEEGDLGALHEIANQATAYQEYARRQDARDRANYFGRVKVLAEANIGVFDVKQNPIPRKRGSLVLGDGVEVHGNTRATWRLLGTGLLVDRLDVTIRQLERSGSDVTTGLVYRELVGEGIAWIDAKPFRKRYLQLNEETGLRQSDVARALGVSKGGVWRYIGAPVKPIPYSLALRLIEILEVDQGQVRGIKYAHKRKRRRSRPRQRKLVGGRLDESYSLIRKALQELDRATGQSNEWGTTEAWEHLYAAETIVGKAMKRAV